tara:strand:- start:314 stop:517 length:204 start_codon:yes stop_codon:yes gene_type:complete
MNEEIYIQESDDENQKVTSDVLKYELAESKARHPAFRGKVKLSNPDFNQNVLDALKNFNNKEKNDRI